MSNKNKSRLIKRLITGAMCLTLVFSINGFASVVSDNDGSAFITKAEFDSLKNNFQSQIDQYNQSIDSKIDGAIAAYLAGLQLSTTQILPYVVKTMNAQRIFQTSKKKPLDYSFGSPILTGSFMRYDDKIDTGKNYNNTFYASIVEKVPDALNKQNKTYISNMDDDKKIAAWAGYYTDVVDRINFMSLVWNGTKHWASNTKLDAVRAVAANTRMGSGWNAFRDKTQSLVGTNIGNIDEVYESSGVTYNLTEYALVVRSILHDLPEFPEWRYVFCFADYYYDLFSNFDIDRQWGYRPMNEDSPYVTKFRNKYEIGKVCWPKNSTFSNLKECINDFEDKKAFLAGGGYTYETWISSKTLSADDYYYARYDTEAPKTSPYMIGFEPIDKWSDIYERESDVILTEDNITKWGAKNTILTDKNDDKHISLAAGVPLFELTHDTDFIWNIKFEDITKDYIIWLKDEPFSKDSPELEAKTLTVTGLDEVNTWHTSSRPNNHAYKVKDGAGTIKINSVPNDGVLFLKWTEEVSDITQAGGGVLVCSETAKQISTN